MISILSACNKYVAKLCCSQTIEISNHHVVDDCFTKMLSHWLKHSTSDHTSLKSKLVKALKSQVIGRCDIVEKIEASEQHQGRN